MVGSSQTVKQDSVRRLATKPSRPSTAAGPHPVHVCGRAQRARAGARTAVIVATRVTEDVRRKVSGVDVGQRR